MTYTAAAVSQFRIFMQWGPTKPYLPERDPEMPIGEPFASRADAERFLKENPVRELGRSGYYLTVTIREVGS